MGSLEDINGTIQKPLGAKTRILKIENDEIIYKLDNNEEYIKIPGTVASMIPWHSSAHPVISPSPCTPCTSPIERSAPSTCTGSRTVEPT